MKRFLLSLYLAVSSLVAFTQPNLTVPTSGNIATREWVEQYLFNHFAECCSGICDLSIDSTRKDGNALEFYLSASSDTATNLHSFSVELSQGSNVWYWNDVPHLWGEWLRIDGIVPTELVNVKIKFSNTPGCYTTSSFNLGAGPCASGPTITSVNSPTSTGLNFVYTGSGITSGNWIIKNSGGTTVRSGNFTSGPGSIPISYAALDNASYTLTVNAANCTGTSTLGFSISGLPSCTAGPLILSVTNVTSTGLTFNFHGVNVFGIDWKILNSSGSVLRSNSFTASYPPIVPITFSALTDGNYNLVISGNTCSGGSNKEFTISTSTGPGEEVALANPGVRSATQGGREFEWIESRNTSLTINSNGSVTLNCPATKTSVDGGLTCYRLVFLNHIPLQGANLTALLGSGLMLDDGATTIHVMYSTQTDPFVLIQNPAPWDLGTRGKSGEVEYLYLGIKTIGYTPPTQSSGVTEVMRPRSLIMPAWSPLWQEDMSWQINPTTDRVFGLTTKLSNVYYRNALKKVTHLQHSGYANDSIGFSVQWKNIRGQGVTPDQVASQYPANASYLGMAQMVEDGFTIDQANEAQRKIYEKLQATLGVTSPAQTNLYDDYFSHLFAGGVDVFFPKVRSGVSALWTTIRGGMANQAAARKIWDKYNPQWGGETAYSLAGWYQFRNWFTGGYPSDFWNTADGVRGYNLVYNLERMALAFPDRKRITYGWDQFDNTGEPIYAMGTFSAIKFSSPNGDIYLNTAAIVPHAILEEDAFWSRLVGNGYVMWNILGNQTKDVTKFNYSFNGGGEDGGWTVPAPWKTLWKPNGGSLVYYDKTNPAHPPMLWNPADSPYSVPGLGTIDVGTQGAASGSHLFDRIEGRQATLVYANFTYTKSGVVTNGYYNGTAPTTGSTGDARVSRYGDANYGQDNIARQAENRLPICMYGTGADGKCIIFCNRYASTGEVQTVVVNNGSGYTFTVKGPGLHVLTMP